jgi:3-oxoacyl-[acyl-carrier-protein] synthase II
MFVYLRLLAALAAIWSSCSLATIKLRNKFAMKTKLHARSPEETIVVTGLGVISPVGTSSHEFFENICSGVSGVSRLERFDPEPYKCQIAAQIKGFEPRDHYKSKKKIKQNDLSCHFAVAASHMALADAGLDLSDPSIDAHRAGVIVGSAFGGMDSFEKAVHVLRDQGVSAIDPYTIPMILGNTAPGIIAMETGAKGPNFGVQTACATGTHALGEVKLDY